jgi:hypothetical protein
MKNPKKSDNTVTRPLYYYLNNVRLSEEEVKMLRAPSKSRFPESWEHFIMSRFTKRV